jgi:hypothetical protein
MPRPKIQISENDLIREITRLEATNEFRNLTALFDAVLTTPWGQSFNGTLNYGVFYQRLREFGLTDKIKTKGKKGNGGAYLAGARAARGPKTSRKEKLAVHQPTFDILMERYPNKVATIERAKNGSLKALVAMKCYDCCGGQQAEIRACTANGCALYPIRPGG